MNNNDIYDEEKRIKEEEKLHEIACEVQFNEDMENFNKTYPHYDNVINLQDRIEKDGQSFISGLAKCLNCKHEWIAVSESLVPYDECLECPSCGLHKGKYAYPFLREGLVWTCGCGNSLMQICPNGKAFCPNCGEHQYYDNANVMISTNPDYIEKDPVKNIPEGQTISVITIQNTKNNGSLLISNDGVSIEIPSKHIDDFIEKIKKHSYTHAVKSKIKYEKPRIIK